MNIVRFACSSGDEPRNYLLDEETFDRWLHCEPPQGYHLCVLLWSGSIDGGLTTDNDFRTLCEHRPR